MDRISEYQLRHHFGATAKELTALRTLFGGEDGDFPTSEACLALLRLRQGNRYRDPITQDWKRQQRDQGLISKLRQRVSRRVPPNA